MNILIALNYQREIPPFMQVELKYADRVFDLVYYISTPVSNAQIVSERYKNVKLIQTSRVKKIGALLKSGFALFKKENISLFKQAKKKNQLSLGLIKYVLKHSYCHHILRKHVNQTVKKHYDRDNVCVLSAWFNEVSYIASKTKEKYPNIKACSFAHAFEIDRTRNPFIEYSFNEYRFNLLNKVFFISQTMLNNYLESLDDSDRNLAKKKCEITYLGCDKLCEKKSNIETEYFEICSCSSVVPVKRLHIILDALKNWNHCKIRWTHLGDGPLMPDIKNMAEEVKKVNVNVEVVLKGKLSNEEVHKYLSSNKVDVFVNVSNREGLPVSIMEAMAYGICVFATDVGGTKEIVNSSNGCLLCKDISSEALLDKLEAYCHLGENEKSELRKNAENTWNEKFNAQENITEFFRSLL